MRGLGFEIIVKEGIYGFSGTERPVCWTECCNQDGRHLVKRDREMEFFVPLIILENIHQ